jgi:UDP-glucose 4-epimerase
MEQPELYFRNNVIGAVHLLDAMLAAGVRRIIFSSTCASYGEPEEIPISEDHPQRPANPYGDSKLMFEKMLLWAQELKGVEPTFLRYFNASGATVKFGEDHDPEPHIIPRVLQVALGKAEKIMIFGEDYDTPDGTCVRDYIHIVDLAQAHIEALTGGHTGAFNLGNGDGYSVKQVIETAREVSGHPIPAQLGPRRAGDPSYLVAKADKARDVLGWKPLYPDLRSIVQSAWDWHRSHPRGYSA